MSHKLVYKFKEPIDRISAHTYIIAQNRRYVDAKITLGRNQISFEYSRSKRHNAKEAADNALREQSLIRALYYYASVSGKVPHIVSASFYPDQNRNDIFRIDTSELQHDWDDWARVRIPIAGFLSCDAASTLLHLYYRSLPSFGQEPESLEAGRRTMHEESDAARSSLSNLFASFQLGADEEGRFRYLWTSFNALYSYLYKLECPKANKTNEADAIYRMSKYVIANSDSFRKSLALFNKSFPPEEELSTLNWFLFKRKDKSKSNSKTADTYNPWPYTKDNSIGLVDETLAKILTEHVPDRTAPFRATTKVMNGGHLRCMLFMLTIYLYKVRCNSLHGEKEYPLFVSKRNRSIKPANDVLQQFIIDLLASFLDNRKLQDLARVSKKQRSS